MRNLLMRTILFLVLTATGAGVMALPYVAAGDSPAAAASPLVP